MSAQIYNEKRRIVFATYHKYGPEKAFEYLEGYHKKLGNQGYTGLQAELVFYHQYGKEFHLTPAGDMGEHADFAGHYDSTPTRFDVTTNLAYKELSTYEKFITEGFNYRIALYDQTNWQIIDILELSFPRCSNCSDGFVFPLVLLLPMNHNKHGDPLWHNDQKIVDFCPSCGCISREEELYNNTIRTTSELYNEFSEELTGEEVDNCLLREHRDTVKYLSKTTNSNLIGIMEEGNTQHHKYKDSEEVLFFPYLADIVKNKFPKLFYI